MRTASTVGHALANLLMPVLGYIELSGRAPDPRLDDAVTRVAAPDVPAMPFNKPQEEAFMPNPEKIAAAMRKLAAY